MVIGAVSAVTLVEGVPLSYTIGRGDKECLYDVLHANEHVTMSVFLTAGSELHALAEIVGPIAPETVNRGAELWNHVELFEQGRSREQPTLRETHHVNYEDLPHLFDHSHHEDYCYHYYHGHHDDDAINYDMYYYYDLGGDMPEWINHYDGQKQKGKNYQKRTKICSRRSRRSGKRLATPKN